MTGTFIKKLMTGVGQAINKTKPNVPTTEIGKKTRDLKIAIQKAKAGKAKLDQTVFEMKNNKPFTFKSNKGKSESNKESYRRIQGENTKVLKGMLDKATGKKDGGRIGRKFGSPNPKKTNIEKIKETFGPKKNVPSKLKGFSKLPEAVQQKMNKKLARKV
jgi:hypothetical protein|tara:strand:+ start:45 stop:524 length:480 start_codon:yes stop_codon:yes gene_type:complete